MPAHAFPVEKMVEIGKRVNVAPTTIMARPVLICNLGDIMDGEGEGMGQWNGKVIDDETDKGRQNIRIFKRFP